MTRNKIYTRQFEGYGLVLTILLMVLPVAYGSQITCIYDDAGRLIHVDYGNNHAISYTYDNAGNITDIERGAAPPTPTPPSTPTPSATPTGGAEHTVPGDFPDIASAVAAANNGDIIKLSAGTFSGTGNYNIDFGGKDLEIEGDETRGATVIDCGSDGRAFTLQNGESSASAIRNIKIVNGLHLTDGGAILCAGSSPLIEYCEFEGCVSESQEGGAIRCESGASPVIRYCNFYENEAVGWFYGGGGAVSVEGNGTVDIIHCSFYGNVSQGTQHGGAVRVDENAEINVVNCIFDGNWSAGTGAGIAVGGSGTANIENGYFVGNENNGSGGAAVFAETGAEITAMGCTFKENIVPEVSIPGAVIVLDGAVVQISDSVFANNHDAAGYGLMSEGTTILTHCRFESDGVRIIDETCEINNCSITGNVSDDAGGAIHVTGSDTDLSISSCTIADNSCGSNPGKGLYCSDNATVTIENSIFWNPGGADEEIHNDGGTVTVLYSDIQHGWSGSGNDNIDADPMFVNGPYGAYHLNGSSPCVNMGSDLAANICFTGPEGTECMGDRSTEWTLFADGGKLDLGYHFPQVLPEPTWTPTPSSMTPTSTPTLPNVTWTPTPSTPTHTPATATHTPTMTPVPTDPPPTATPTGVTATPTSTPPEPTSTPSPVCGATGVTLEMPTHAFSAGDTCGLNAFICNRTGAVLSGYPLFVILDVYGSYWFAPSWKTLDQGIDYYDRDFEPGMTEMTVLPEFTWPEGTGTASGIVFIGAMTDPGISRIYGDWASWSFDYH